MAAGRRFLRSTISLLVYVFLCLYKVSFTSYSQLSVDLDCRITFHGYLQSPKRNISFSTWTFQPRGRRYLSAPFHSIQTMRPVLLWQEFQIAETLNLIQVLLLTARLLHCALCVRRMSVVITKLLNVMCVNIGVTSNVAKFRFVNTDDCKTYRISTGLVHLVYLP